MAEERFGLDRVAVRSTVDEVAARLREAILAGRIRPGEHLAERQLGAELGVSNIALREAFSRLVEEGLVVRVARRGAFAAPISPERVRDLTRVRIALESLAVELAMDGWTGSDADRRAEEVVAAMEAAAERRDHEALFRLDQEFHQVFWEAAGSPTLQELTLNLRGRILRSIREAMMAIPDDRLSSLAQVHRDWLEAVRSGDVERARAEVANHIERAATDIIAALERAADEGPPQDGRRWLEA